MQTRSGNHAQGIDVSHWQGSIDWQKVRAAGKSFVFIKATESSRYTDNHFFSYLKGAKSAGLLVGAYHFTRAAKPADVKAEVDHFLEVINQAGGLSAFDLPFVLDAETKEAGTRANVTATVRSWVDEFKRRTGQTPLLYTYPSFIEGYLDSSLADVPLWYAYYSNVPPVNKSGWKSWEFLQYTSEGKVPGISGQVDLNEYKGSEAELMAVYKKGNDGSESPGKNHEVPAWKESGRQWLIDHAGISSDWKAEDPVDIGTLGAILAKFSSRNKES
ncbi:Lysozyme M1 precursor [compost metagenome]